MPANVDILFEPFTVNGVTLPNRIVMAPMTRQLLSEPAWANKVHEGRYREIEPYTQKWLKVLS